MAFILSHVDIIEDQNARPCLCTDDALTIAQALATDPELPTLFNTNCGHRAELMIGRLVTSGFPAELIHRAHIYTTNTELQGDEIWSKRNPPEATFQNLIGQEPESYPATFDIPDIQLRILFLDAEEVYVWDKNDPRGNDYSAHQGYKDFEPGFALHFNGENDMRLRQHHTIALPVLNEKTGQAEIKVIDPHLTRPVRLLSFSEWRDIQNGENSVMLCGPVGQPEHIVNISGTDNADLQKLFNNENGYGNTNFDYDWDNRSEQERIERTEFLIYFLEPLATLEQKWREKFFDTRTTPSRESTQKPVSYSW